MKITVEQALEIWNDRANGADEGRSTSKGGRAWLSGEFRLAELEALCMILRHEAGKLAEGLPELLRHMQPVPELSSLSEPQRAVVSVLNGLEPDFAVTFAWIASESGVGSEKKARNVTRQLAKMGITEFVRGLTDEYTCQACGSGYRLSSMGRQMVRWSEGEIAP
jgi:hypothetical protein